MPAGILIGIITWFASHLILFTLLGFVVAGLVVFGVVDVGPRLAADRPVGPAVGALEAPQSAAAGADVRPVDASGPASSPAPSPQSPADQTRDPSSGPRLIGGSLPVYAQLPRDGEPAQRTDVDGFRPPAALGSPAAPSYGDRIQRARQAYWNGDFESAEAYYMDVIEAYPNDADAFGELGNLYEAMARPTLARDAFFAAGVRLKAAGEREKLRQVIDFLADKGDERALTLQQ